jgi:hypothetical protein
MNYFSNLFSPRRLTESDYALFDLLRKSPLLDEVIEASEVESLNRRRELLSEIPKLTKDKAAEEARADKAGVLASEAVAQAEASYHRARAAHDAARLQAANVGRPFDDAIRELQDEVRSLADPRLATFAAHLGNLQTNDCVLKLSLWVTKAPGNFHEDGAVSYATNLAEVQAAKDALHAAIAKAKALRLEPLSSAEVSEFLAETCAGLAPVLAPLEINPPSLTREDHDVGAAQPWSGTSRWLFDDLPQPWKADTKRTPNPNVSKRRASLARA